MNARITSKPSSIRVSRGSVVVRAYDRSFDNGTIINEKKTLKKWIESGNIFDIAALGPRAGLGLLDSLSKGTLPKVLSETSAEISEIFSSPVPANEKPFLLAAQWEDKFARFVEVGEVEEQKLLQQVEGVLPTEIRQAIPAPWPSTRPPTQGGYAPSSPAAGSSVDSYVPSQQSLNTIGRNNAAAEMLQLQMAVAGVRRAIEELSANADPNKEKMFKLNGRDARDLLARRVREISPATRKSEDAAVQAAIMEAEMFLSEVGLLFN